MSTKYGKKLNITFKFTLKIARNLKITEDKMYYISLNISNELFFRLSKNYSEVRKNAKISKIVADKIHYMRLKVLKGILFTNVYKLTPQNPKKCYELR